MIQTKFKYNLNVTQVCALSRELNQNMAKNVIFSSGLQNNKQGSRSSLV